MEPDERRIKEMVVASLDKCVACGAAYGVDNIRSGPSRRSLFLMVACQGCSTTPSWPRF